jgi:hypothetical protein
MEGPGYMSEGERRKLEHRLAMARRFLNAADDDLTKERLRGLIRELGEKLKAAKPDREIE